MEIFNIVKESLSLVIMGAGVIIAGMALYTWKKEFIGKKKIDLACDIIEQVCNIQDIIRYARSPAFYTNESNKINTIITSITIFSNFLYEYDDLSYISKKEYEKDIWCIGNNDEIETKVQKIVDEFKLNLEPLYKDRLTKWKKLKK